MLHKLLQKSDNSFFNAVQFPDLWKSIFWTTSQELQSHCNRYQNLNEVNVKFSLYLTKYHSMNTRWGLEVWLHAFLTSTLYRGEWSASSPSHLTPKKTSPFRYPLDSEVRWASVSTAHVGEQEKHLPCPFRESKPRSSSSYPSCYIDLPTPHPRPP
jgi:hypothetical protein